MTWSEISSNVGGKPPLAKAYFNMVAEDGKLYLFGGGNDAGIASKNAAHIMPHNRSFFVLDVL